MREGRCRKGFAVRGMIYALMDDAKAALADFAKLDFTQPQPPDLYIYRSICYSQLNSPEDMLQSLSEGLKFHPGHIDLLKERAYTCFRPLH